MCHLLKLLLMQFFKIDFLLSIRMFCYNYLMNVIVTSRKSAICKYEKYIPRTNLMTDQATGRNIS